MVNSSAILIYKKPCSLPFLVLKVYLFDYNILMFPNWSTKPGVILTISLYDLRREMVSIGKSSSDDGGRVYLNQQVLISRFYA